MKKLIPLICALFIATSAWAHPDSDTKSVITSVNPASGSFGDQNYPPELYGFMLNEDAYRSYEYGFVNFVSTVYLPNACLGTTGAGLTMTPASCTAYNEGWRGTEVGSITFPNNSVCWVAMDENTTGNNASIPTFTRVPSTHYLIDCTGDAQPAMAADTQLLMRVTTVSGAITAVSDLRNLNAAISIPSTLPCVNGSRCGEDNIGLLNPVGLQPWALETPTVTTSNNSPNVSCPSGCGHVAVGQNIAIYNAANSPTAVSTPFLTIIPETFSGVAASVDGVVTGLQNTCTPFNPKVWGTLGNNYLITSNTYAFERSNTLTIEGNSYQVCTTAHCINHVLDSIPLTSNLLTQVSGRQISDGVLNGTATFTSVTAAFVAGDVNRGVTGIGIPLSALANGVTLPTATIPVTTLSGFANTTASLAIGSQQVSCTGTGTGSGTCGAGFSSCLTTCTGGAGFFGINTPVMPVIATVTNGTTAVLSEAATVSGTEQLTFGPEQVTGANCTTTRSVESYYIYSNGFWSGPSNVASSSATSNSLNFYNVVQVQDTRADHNAIAEVFYCAEGAGSLSMCGVQRLDQETFNPQNFTSPYTFLNDDWLMTNPGKQAVSPVVFHEVGMSYGNDLVNGSAPPTATNGIYYGVVQSVGTNSFVTSPNVPLAATNTILSHDDGPLVNEALTNAVVNASIFGNFTDYFIALYLPRGQYPIVTPIVFPNGGGSPFPVADFHLYGDGGMGDTGNIAPSRLVYRGPVGGDIISAVTQLPYMELDHFGTDDTGGSTAGVALDIDSPNVSGAPTTQGDIHDASFIGATTGMRFANVNTQNVEFFRLSHVLAGGELISGVGEMGGEYGIDKVSGNSLGFPMSNMAVRGQIGIRDVAGDFIDSTNFPVPGSIALLTFQYLGTPMTLKNTRQEHLSGVVLDPTANFGSGTLRLTLQDNIFADDQYLPSCTFLQNWASGWLHMTHNDFDSIHGANNDYYTPTVCPNGIVSLESGSVFLESKANNFDDVGPLNQGNTYGEIEGVIPPSNLDVKDTYRSYFGGAYVLAPPPPQASPTFLTVQGPCPETILNVQNTLQPTTCVIANGAHVIFPFQTGNNTLWGTFEANTGQGTCEWHTQTLGDMSSGNTRLSDWENSALDLACYATCGNPGTLNLCFVTSTGFELDNETGASLPLLATSHFGIY